MVHWFQGIVDGNSSHGSSYCYPECPFWESARGKTDTQARIEAENQQFFREIEGTTENLDGR